MIRPSSTVSCGRDPSIARALSIVRPRSASMSRTVVVSIICEGAPVANVNLLSTRNMSFRVIYLYRNKILLSTASASVACRQRHEVARVACQHRKGIADPAQRSVLDERRDLRRPGDTDVNRHVEPKTEKVFRPCDGLFRVETELRDDAQPRARPVCEGLLFMNGYLLHAEARRIVNGHVLYAGVNQAKTIDPRRGLDRQPHR